MHISARLTSWGPTLAREARAERQMMWVTVAQMKVRLFFHARGSRVEDLARVMAQWLAILMTSQICKPLDMRVGRKSLARMDRRRGRRALWLKQSKTEAGRSQKHGQKPQRKTLLTQRPGGAHWSKSTAASSWRTREASLATISRWVGTSWKSHVTALSDTDLPERTFLAWLRTSLSFASIGIAVTQLFRLNASLKTANKRDIESTLVSPSQTSPSLSEQPLLAIAASQPLDKQKLSQLGKPLGATFLGICKLCPPRLRGPLRVLH